MNMIYVLQMNGEQDWEYEEIPLERVSNNIYVGIFRAQEPKAPVTYCDHALSGVRPSVRRPSSVVR